MRRYRTLVALFLTLAALTGCSAAQSTACPPVESGVGVCVNGKAIDWSAVVMKPHMHENGGYYAHVEQLAEALHVNPVVASNKKSVLVGDKQVTALAPEAKGVHVHEDFVFVPIKEFAEAAGFKAIVDTTHHTVNMIR